MADSRFDVVFEGKLVKGSHSDAVKSNLMRLFKVNEAKAAALLSGKRVVLKKNADQVTAMKFRAALKQAGAVCTLESLDEPASEQSSSSTSTSPISKTPAASSGDVAMVGTIRTGGDGFVGEFGVAEAGADMNEIKPDLPAVEPDISGINMAPVGSDMGQKPADPPGPEPDISGISLVDE